MNVGKIGKKGQIVIPKEIRKNYNIKPGDVILFYSEGVQVIHRVMFVKQVGDNFYYTTKGDANPQSSVKEKDIPYKEVKGKLVWKAPYLGYPRVILSYIMPF